ncbi:MAG: DEAD/DEAH box helicase [Gemmatimonadaceae bacterium]
MSRQVSSVSGRLSLRAPQRESLEILAQVADIIPLDKQRDVAEALSIIRSEYPSVTDFERDFPSLCFALATGVGKTRLMGAFVAYLHLAKGIRHFFVLAPNLTIYNKLITDFSPGNPKYVLHGIAEFAQNPPEIITGDNYESGRGVRGARDLFGERDVHINIFNISKINSEVRGGAAPRIKRLSEYIGESYFEYLAGLDDLVLMMDESHRYRASAGVKAINELNPVLGLELTATPQVEAARGPVRFNNIIFDYPLAAALRDGFVKQPAVATRENFNPANYTDDSLERLKLEDGIRVHESTKVELETYARENDVKRVKPFMLIIARDTTHAGELKAQIEADDFFGGRYKERVITVHSNIRGEEKDETVERLLQVESPEEPTEIVIHVNMLKEGWDVTNLYTIVPLRAANARTLVEQSIGRGLRLPYGRRTGVKAVDRLTIVAHDKFQEIVDEANRPDSPIRMETVIVGRDIPEHEQTSVVIPSYIESQLSSGTPAAVADGNRGGSTITRDGHGAAQQRFVFETPAEQAIARATLAVVKQFEYLPQSRDLQKVDVRAELVRAVTASMAPVQHEMEGVTQAPDVAEVVAKAVDLFVEQTIDVPRIIVVPTGEVTTGFDDFDLEPPAARLQPVDEAILVHGLVDNERERLAPDGNAVTEQRPEDYLVATLIDYSDISYDDTADLLYKLAGQMIAYLGSYLPDDDAVDNVLRHHRKPLAAHIHAQMQVHRWERTTGYEARVSKGFTQLRPLGCTVQAGSVPRPFREPVDDPQYIRGLRFTGFRRCLYPEQRFDSDTERRFAVLLEDESGSLKWFKPGKGQLNIYYSADHSYEPDFIVETETTKYLCEPKRATEMDDPIVLEKARAAAIWCRHATEHAAEHGGKPWAYLLIPHTSITGTATLANLANAYTVTA